MITSSVPLLYPLGHWLVFLLAGAVWLWARPTLAQDAARPDVAPLLQAAQALLHANRFDEALAKVGQAEGVSGKTPYETYLIEHTRGRAAMGAGDNQTAIKAFEAALASNQAPPAERLKTMEALARAYYRNQDYVAAVRWATGYFREGGRRPQMRTLLSQAHFQSGDVASAGKEVQAELQAEANLGRVPAEEKLQLLAHCHLRQNNPTGYLATVEKLLTYYPKKSLWADVVSRIRTWPDFPDRLPLETYRLQWATGTLNRSADYMEMAHLALQAGLPNEAKKVVDEGYASGVLGQGAELARQKRLKDRVDKRFAEQHKALPNEAAAEASADGNALVHLGFNQGGAQGIALMEAGIKKGGLTYPEDAKLHLGILLLQAGQKARAAQVLKTVQGTDGVAGLARLWLVHAHRVTDPGGLVDPLGLRVFWTYFAH